jgi:hypothetical protein
MRIQPISRRFRVLFLSILLVTPISSTVLANGRRLMPADMPGIGVIDERFQSYNIEMLEVTGGNFWKPYDETGRHDAKAPTPTDTRLGADVPAGMDPNIYEYRPPIDQASKGRRGFVCRSRSAANFCTKS